MKTHMRVVRISVVVLVWAASAFADDKPKPAKAPPAPKTAAPPPATANAHPAAPPGPGQGPAAIKQGEHIEKLAKMSPAQREKALANLPPERRAKIEAGIAKWNMASAQLKSLTDKFQSLPPEQQKRVRQLSQRLKSLPPNRKIAVGAELDRLRAMPEKQRARRVENPAFKKNFTPEEQEILREVPAVLPPNYF